ncbi:MAG: UDP-N-acetylglucosamine--N-acetylmuramyl-(pentapeptide) pyrophosphoryl-undecaprenol N-acetylglucosamine transferase [Patescibacteria group bacterium]
MKIVITGGGSGGHFYPLIAVADKIIESAEDRKMLVPEIHYLADDPYNENLLLRKGIIYHKIYAGKMRRYFSWRNITDLFTTIFGTIKTFFLMFRLYPDVVFTNGSYVSMPVLVSARILRIPVVIHASDTVPGRALIFASRFAKKISIAFPGATKYFRKKDQNKIALLGNPIRDEIEKPLSSGAREFLELSRDIPTILVLGGSQGAQAMNDVLVDTLPKLLLKYNVIHQCGKNNFEEVKGHSDVVLYDHPFKSRYKLYPYLDDLAMRMSVGASSLAIIRAGAGTISEVANWGLPSILIPIPEDVSRDQESNAFAYARSGASTVIKQSNLSASILYSEIERIMNDDDIRNEMIEAAKAFSRKDSALKIADEILEIARLHEA